MRLLCGLPAFRSVELCLLSLVSLVMASSLPAAVLTPVFHQYDATADTDADNTLEDTGSASAKLDFTLANVTRVALAGHGYSFTHAYDFPGTGTGSGPQTGSGQSAIAGSFNAASATLRASFELWVRIDALPANDRQMILFETGGTTGASLNLWRDPSGNMTINFSTPSIANAAYAFGAADVGRFLHLVGVIDPANTRTQLYVNGGAGGPYATTVNAVTTNWRGSDQSALGISSTASGVTGPLGTAKTVPLNGQIAMLRHYNDVALTSAQVAANYANYVPEPTTLLLLPAALLMRRR